MPLFARTKKLSLQLFMKKIFFLFWFILLTVQFINGQGIDESISTTPKELHDLYMKKNRTNKITGWTLVGAGIGMTLGGFAINAASGWGEGNTNKGLGLTSIGEAVTILSIPFFISAGSNKRKATLALKGEPVAKRNKTPDNYGSHTIALIVKF